MWSVKSVVEAFKNNQPELFQLFENGIAVYNTDFEDDFIRDNYGKAENISVDYAIMEKSQNVFVFLLLSIGMILELGEVYMIN